MADSVFLRHFITLIVNSFELTPGTLVNDLCTYWSQPAGYWCLSDKLRRAWLPRAAFGIHPGELTLLCGSTGWRIIMRTLSPCLALAYGPETKWLFLTFWLMTLAHQHILFSNTHQLAWTAWMPETLMWAECWHQQCDWALPAWLLSSSDNSCFNAESKGPNLESYNRSSSVESQVDSISEK